MIVEPPKTLEDFQKVRETILELMANPYCDQFMFLSLSEKLDKADIKIKELSNLTKQSMEQKEIEEGNKLIALFMGGVRVGDGQIQLGENPHTDRYYYLFPENPSMPTPQYLQYHTSWEWRLLSEVPL
jgi:hypothetical protein